MHNFGRGMWRRVGDYEKQQQKQNTNSRLAQYLEYIQMQKQRAIDAYYGMKKKEETSDKPKDEVAAKDEVTAKDEDGSKEITIVEQIIEPEPESEEVIRDATIVEPEVEVEVEVEVEQKSIANDITIVDLICEEETLINQPEAVASDIPIKPSKKRGKKNSGKV